MRKTSALVIAVALVAPLGGCALSTAASACTPVYASGGASDLVTATGTVGSAPTVDFPTPLIADGVQVTPLVTGEGAPLQTGDVVDMHVSIYVGATGELLTQSSYDPTNPVRRAIGQDNDVIGDLANCATVGGRAAATVSVTDIYGEDQLDASLGLSNDDTLVVVLDVQRAFPGRATGVDQLPETGMPSIVLSPAGVPGFTLPNEPAPTELRVALLKSGNGATVRKNDEVVLQYSVLVWNSKTVVDSTWERGVPSTFLAASLADNPTAGTIPGFAKAIIGKKIGSQVLTVIPPSEGYPEGSSPASIPAGATLVFVIDLLGIQQ